MDFLKKAAGELQGNKNAAPTGSAPATDGSAPAAGGADAGASTGQQDYGDKGMSYLPPSYLPQLCDEAKRLTER